MTTTAIGDAAPGWPVAGALLDATRLHLVSRNLDRTRVAVVDIGRWTVTETLTTATGDGAWGLTKAPDGVYLGLYGARGLGNLVKVDKGALRPVAAIDADYLWDLTTLSDGRVLGVATEPALVFTYDPTTQRARVEEVGSLGPSRRPRTCTATASHLVVGGSDAGKAFLVDRPVSGGAVRDILPPALRGDATVYCSTTTSDGRVVVGTGGARLDRPAVAVVDPDEPAAALVVRLPREALVDTVTVVGADVWATARPSGGLYRMTIAGGAVARRAVPVPMSETRSLAAAGPRLVAASADGSVWAHDRISGATSLRDVTALGLTPRPQRTQSLSATTERVLVSGSFSVTRHDLSAGTARTAFLPGEAKAMTTVERLTYLAIYPVGEIWVWSADEDRPRRVTQLDSDQLRPIALEWVPRVGCLVATTTDDRDRHVLHTIDPVTGRIDHLDNPLGAGGLAGLSVSGPTVYVGGSGTRPAVGAMDILTGRLRWTVDNVVPDGGYVLGLESVGGVLAVTTSRGWFTTVDLSTRSVAAPVRVAPTAGRLRRVGGRLLLATGDALLHLDPTARTATTVVDGLDGAWWGWPSVDGDDAGRAWTVAGRRLVHTAPTP